MNKEIKARWIRALRSGLYNQGRGRLRWNATESSNNETAFCCLGVLCEIARDNGIVEWNYTRGWYFDPKDPNDREFGSFPLAVRKWAGFHPDQSNPVIDYDVEDDYYGNPITLAELNDEVQLNFSQIADLIEQQL